jgi:thiol:disulfide interchange protein
VKDVFQPHQEFDSMKRRQFLAVSSLALAVPGSLLAGEGQVEYSRAAFDQLLADGKPVLLDFYTTW